jgi:hypothetical protein
MEIKSYKNTIKASPIINAASTPAAKQSTSPVLQITDPLSPVRTPTDTLPQKSRQSPLSDSFNRSSRFKSLQFDSSISFRKASKLTFSPDVKIKNDKSTNNDLCKVSRQLTYAESKSETEHLNLNTKLIEAEERRLLWSVRRFERQLQMEQERKQQLEEAEDKHKFLRKLREGEQERKLKEREEAVKFKAQNHFELKEVKQHRASEHKSRLQDDLARASQLVDQNFKYREDLKKAREAERRDQRALFIEKVQTQKERKAEEDALQRQDLAAETTVKAEDELVIALRRNQEAISRLMTMRSVTSRESNP